MPPVCASFQFICLQYLCVHRHRIFLIFPSWFPVLLILGLPIQGCVKYSILVSGSLPLSAVSLFNLFLLFLMEAKLLTDPPMALDPNAEVNSPRHQQGHLRRRLLRCMFLCFCCQLAFFEGIIFNSRLSPLPGRMS